MKNFFRIIVLTAIFCLAVSCENTLSKMELEENNGDETDSGISDDDADSADSDVPDNSDTETPDEPEDDGENNDSDNDETLYSTCSETRDCVAACSAGDNGCIMDCYNNSSTTAQNDFMALVECKQENCMGSDENCLYEYCASEAAACGMTKPERYHSPYGLVSLSFNNQVGTAEDSKSYEEIFATGTYGNGSAEILPGYADEVKTEVYIDNGQLKILQFPIYDDTFVNPVVFFYLPLDKAENAGLYTINYNGDALVFVADFNMDYGLECYHAFGKGQLEIFESNINGVFGAINFSGEAALYHPTNYDGIDISAEFLQIAGMGPLCEPVD